MTVTGQDRAPPAAKLERSSGADTVRLKGSWTIGTIAGLDETMAGFARRGREPLIVDASGLDQLDTAGAWLIARLIRDARRAHREVSIQPAPRDLQSLLDAVVKAVPPELPPRGALPPWMHFLMQLGQWTLTRRRDMLRTLNFFGLLLVTLARTAREPRRLRVTSLVFHMKSAGLDAVPIVATMSFLLGIVIAYQGAMQLQRYGAEIFTVNLTALSILREIGILLTAILVAGRSGSAFTAAIGSMKVREEIDALRAMGLDPIEFLVVPRALALLISMPLLGFVSDIVGLLGGLVMCWGQLHISPDNFITIIRDSVGVSHFFVGEIKAPFFALAIATIGCHQGFEVEASAESVGRRTTVSVVESIFLMIILDAAFSIFFATINY